MKNYRPLLFEDVDLRVGGLQVTSLRLNRHTPEAKPDRHRHKKHGQLLIYLSGSGWQEVEGERMVARAGTVIYIAPDQLHAFERDRVRQPLCVVIDLHLDRGRRAPKRIAQLTATELTQIRSRLSGLFGTKGSEPDAMALQVGALILDVLDPVLAALGWLGEKRVRRVRSKGVTRKVERALANGDLTGIPLRELAQNIGYQQDHLNRLLKAESGLTLGQMQAKARLEIAQRLLRDRGRSVTEVAEGVGMFDNNYFARWFKQQTGVTPSAWRQGYE